MQCDIILFYSVIREDGADPAVQVMTRGRNIVHRLEGSAVVDQVVVADHPWKIADTGIVRVTERTEALPIHQSTTIVLINLH